MGKTSTLGVVQDELTRKRHHVIMADLSTGSEVVDLANRILQAATAELGRRWKGVLNALIDRLSVRIGVTPDASGVLLPSVDVALRQADLDEQRRTLAGVLDALDALAAAKRTRIGVILDEFQEIHRFGGERAEAHLRSVIQRHEHVSYVLAGSDERLIRAMISSRRPLYKLLDHLHFGPMDAAHLAHWIDERYGAAGMRSKVAGERIVALAWPRTRDVVQLARAAFDLARSGGRVDESVIADAFRQVVMAEEAPTRALWDSLSPLQQNVLRAVACRASGLTTQATRSRFGLGDTGPASKAARTLVGRDLLVKSGAEYRYDSPFTRGWVIMNTLADIGMSRPVTHVP